MVYADPVLNGKFGRADSYKSRADFYFSYIFIVSKSMLVRYPSLLLYVYMRVWNALLSPVEVLANVNVYFRLLYTFCFFSTVCDCLHHHGGVDRPFMEVFFCRDRGLFGTDEWMLHFSRSTENVSSRLHYGGAEDRNTVLLVFIIAENHVCTRTCNTSFWSCGAHLWRYFVCTLQQAPRLGWRRYIGVSTLRLYTFGNVVTNECEFPICRRHKIGTPCEIAVPGMS